MAVHLALGYGNGFAKVHQPPIWAAQPLNVLLDMSKVLMWPG
jgi:hypothetical protein